MSTENNKNIVRRWIEEGWNKGNLALVDELYTADYVQHDPNSPVLGNGRKALKGYVGALRGAFPDLHFTIGDMIAEGDQVALRFTMRGTQTGPFGNIPASGKAGVATGQLTFRLEAEKIAEVWVNVDVLGLMQQLGVIPAMA
jgi:steroid delta-isomerase-like uncharacterized protein